MKLADLHKRRIAAVLQRHGVKGPKLEAALKKIEGALIQFSADREAESAARYQDAEFISEHRIRVFAPKPRSLRGPIPKLALHKYLQSLVTIYEQATGKQIVRSNYADHSKPQKQSNQKKPSEERRDTFLFECVRAAGIWPSRYPRWIIRDELHKLHPNAKRGRPKKLNSHTFGE